MTVRRRILILLAAVLAAAPGCAALAPRHDASKEPDRTTTAQPAPSAAKPAPPRTTYTGPPAGSAKSAPSKITPQHRLEIEREYRQGIESFEAGLFLEAAGYLEAVRRWMPGYEQSDDYLRRSYLAIGMKQYTDGDLEGAIRIWKEVLRIDPKDKQALAYISKTEEELRRFERSKKR